MITFRYTARNRKGHKISGEAEARSESELHEQLSRLGLTITHVVERDRADLGRSRRLDAREMVVLCRQFYHALQTGADAVSTLESIQSHVRSKHVAAIAAELRLELERGHSLSRSFAALPHVFDRFFIHCVAAGEKAGRLDTVFEQLAEYYQQQMVYRRNLMKALRYPFLSTLFTSGLIFWLLAVIYYLITASSVQVPDEVMRHLLVTPFSFAYLNALILLVGLNALAVLFRRASERFALALDSVWLMVPGLGSVCQARELARYSFFLSLLYDCGIPMGDAAESAAGVIRNTALAVRVKEAAAYIQKGFPPSDAFSQLAVPPLMGKALRLGETTGNFSVPLGEMRRQLDLKAQTALDALVQYVRPVLMLFSAALLFAGASGL